MLSIIVLMTACDAPRTGDPATGESETASVSGSTNGSAEALGEEGEPEDWQILFDGENLDGWRGFQSRVIPPGWTVTDDGAIHFASAEGDIDLGLITDEQFSDFDLRFEWRVAPGGNSGVFFHVTEDEDTIWKTGPEYQIVDNIGHDDGENPVTSAGANYGLYGPDEDFSKPAGEYNEGRILVRAGRVQHFLNDQKVVDYRLGSDDWEDRVGASSFNEMPAYGRTGSGHIALQEGGPVWYRNIRIRSLGADEQDG